MATSDPLSDEPAGLETRRRLVEKMFGQAAAPLTSTTRDGIRVEPLYQACPDAEALWSRGARPWRIVQLIDDADPERMEAQIAADLEGGAKGFALRFRGAPSAGRYGVPADRPTLQAVLDRVDIAAVQLRIDPHREAPATARALAKLIAQSGLAPERALVSFGLDPISIAAASGVPDPDVGTESVASFRHLRDGGYVGAFAELDTRVFHEAGASEAQELAAMLAAAAWWLRALGPANISPEDSIPHLGATLVVDRDQLLSMAKLRSARLLWARLREVCSAPPAPLLLHAETSRRMLTRADPPTNLLRNTIAAFAAGVGGADSLAVRPHTTALGLPDSDARALARNLQHLLIEEAHLAAIDDPAAGSGAVEALTDALAEHAWDEFGRIEGEGGIMESLGAGRLQARIAASRGALRASLAGAPLVGASVYQASANMPAVESAGDAASGPGLAATTLEALARAA